MPDLRLEREFAVSVETLFAFVSTPEGLMQWWGPEGVNVVEDRLDFTTTGPWFATMRSDEGNTYKVSGQITHVKPPESIGLTWAWHDETDTRGVESHVTFTIEATDSGARLILDHRDLPDADAADGHTRGWTSSLRKLERVAV